MAIQLVVDGLKLQPCNPTFLDARDAILTADQANNGGANECLIWSAFAGRGMGFSADDGGSSGSLAVTEAFDLPAQCIVGCGNGICELGETCDGRGGTIACPSDCVSGTSSGAVCGNGERDRAVAWEAVANFKRELDLRKSGEVSVHPDPAAIANGGISNGGANTGAGSGWVIIDGRGKSCAGVIAALSQQMTADTHSFVEAILADALNIYDVIVWAENAGHRLITQRKDTDGTTRVLLQPNGRS